MGAKVGAGGGEAGGVGAGGVAEAGEHGGADVDGVGVEVGEGGEKAGGEATVAVAEDESLCVGDGVGGEEGFELG